MADPKFKPHPIISKLEASGAVKLLGYFGGTADGVVKVYPSLDDLSVCLRIRETDILHVQEATPEECPHGGSAIWVKPDALIERAVSQSSAIQARFLAGGIAARMAGGPAVAYSQAAGTGGGGAGGGGENPTWAGPTGCTYIDANCNYSVWPCSQLIGACMASNDMPCAYTQQWWCPGPVPTAQSCFTCAGYTCVAVCYSAGCPPTVKCPPSIPYTRCRCEVFSAFCK
jgi:hypothetical protein